MDRSWQSLLQHRRSLFALALCLAGVGLYARSFESSYPIAQWLAWDLATLWGWSLLFVLGCLSVGLRILRLLGIPRGGQAEVCTLGMAAGVTAFALSMYALGALGWFRGEAMLGLVAVMLAIGWRELRDALRELFSTKGRHVARSTTAALATGFGALCLGAVYFGILTPDALNYDATWVHVTIAEDYARQGFLAPFYADYTRNVPHLTSLVYTWAYLVPGLETPQRWMLVLHLEFVLFVWTLVGIAASTRWLLRDANVSGTWAAFFLFPIIFVYDSNLGGAADHALAFFAMPLLLTARLVLRDFAPGPCYLLAILGAGAALTKYQALYLLVPLVPALGVRWVSLMRGALRDRRTSGSSGDSTLVVLGCTPGIMLGLFLVVFSPHLAKNYYYHQNPFYPFMREFFEGSTPTVPNAAFYVENVFKDTRWVPPGGFLERATHAARLFFTFSFTPHYSFTKGWPVFGSLFTLLLPALVVVRERRIWLAAGTASFALFLWAYTFNVDRNLQIFLPYMVCVTAALLVRLWQVGVLARVGVTLLVGLQVVAGADAVFYTAQPSFQSSMKLLASGYEGRASTRYAEYRATHRAIGNALPKEARVLLHTHHPSLGINREVLLDWTGHQGLVSYAHVTTVGGLAKYYQSLGVTHLLYVPGEWQASSRKEEVLFNRLVSDHAAQVRAFGPYRLLPVPRGPFHQEEVMTVASLGMPGYSDGLYSVDQMNVNEYIPQELRVYPPPKRLATSKRQREAILASASAVFVGAGYSLQPTQSAALRSFQRVTGYPGLFSLFLRRSRTTGSPPVPGGSRPGAVPSGARSGPGR